MGIGRSFTVNTSSYLSGPTLNELLLLHPEVD